MLKNITCFTFKLSNVLFMLINVKIVGILTSKSMINFSVEHEFFLQPQGQPVNLSGSDQGLHCPLNIKLTDQL